jgi:hypothetical protein
MGFAGIEAKHRTDKVVSFALLQTALREGFRTVKLQVLPFFDMRSVVASYARLWMHWQKRSS